MNTISVNYTLEFELDFAPQYKWTKDGLCFNSTTGRKLKQCLNSGCIGYNIKGKFYSLKHLRKHIRKIEILEIPF